VLGIRELDNANFGHDISYCKFLVVFLSDSSVVLGQYLKIRLEGHLSSLPFKIGPS
jgi:hypothetical protein